MVQYSSFIVMQLHRTVCMDLHMQAQVLELQQEVESGAIVHKTELQQTKEAMVAQRVLEVSALQDELQLQATASAKQAEQLSRSLANETARTNAEMARADALGERLEEMYRQVCCDISMQTEKD